jgi:feruloyl esterase
LQFGCGSRCLSLGLILVAAEARALDCAALTQLDLGHTQITTAESVAAGSFQVDPRGFRADRTNELLRELPAFCRMEAIARPSADSEIGIEIWLPANTWNGKLQAVGNGGWAGSIGYPAMAGAVAAGFAAAATDTGHKGGDISFAIGHPEKLVDFAHRSLDEMTVAAKAVIEAHYEQPASRAYFAGCSTGGRQALTLAQRYPDHYDGIVAGAAAYHPTHLQGMQVWTNAQGQRSAGAAIAQAQFELVNSAVVSACDRLDGVADGVLENPAQCDFDPATLVCASGNGGACLAPEQADTFRRVYQGPLTASGESLFPGLARGSELGWNTLLGDKPLTLADDTYRYLVFDNRDWDFRSIEPEVDFPIGVERIGALMNADDPDLGPFLDRDGKLLLYHGWNDPGIPAAASIRYYDAVRQQVGAAADHSVSLFMVPGMNHCGGGVGTDSFDPVAALDQWIETDERPARIEAARVEDGERVRSRPLGPYPQLAVYDGSGSTDQADNFICR